MRPNYEVFEKLLRETGQSTADVSKATGINQSVFSDWKRGKSCPKFDKVMMIAAHFGVSPMMFMKEPVAVE